jgi:hypothetical protein
MEILGAIAEFIPALGFPIVCVIGLGWFIYKIYNDTTKQNQANMEAVQARCKEREEKLYVQLEKQNEINGKFANIIAQYDVKLDNMQSDINDIKQDVAVIMNK